MLTIYQVDAFAENVFKGNPAAVVPLDEWLDDAIMQNIAMENNLSETAFFIPNGEQYDIRWFTPETEIDLCGHATLASAHVLWNHQGLEKDSIIFNSKSGELVITKDGDAISMDFPSDSLNEYEDNKHELAYSLGNSPTETYKGRYDFLCVFDNQEAIENLKPDFVRLKRVEARGIIVTAPGEKSDFVSRFFAPQSGINEDPVTGSAHTSLTNYWSNRLNKSTLKGIQLSKRQGVVDCQDKGPRVSIKGNSKTYLIGNLVLPQ